MPYGEGKMEKGKGRREKGAAAVVVLSAMLAACDWSFLVVTPGVVVVGVDLRLHPIAPFPQLISFPNCPAVHPFVARFDIVVSATGDRRVQQDLEGVDVSFSDRRGMSGPSATLDRDEIRRQLGSTTIGADQSRNLTFNHGFGCGTLSSGTIVVIVRARDSNGGVHTARSELALNAP
jgi:hypothetical protein